MNESVIRDPAADDLQGLARLYRQFWGEDCSPETMRLVFDSVSHDPRYVFLVAEERGVLAGTVRGVVCAALYGDCRPFMVVDDVIVDREFRRRGIGGRLMRRLEKRAASFDCGCITLVTETSRTDALRFYDSLGYSPDAYVGYKKRL
jgi:ribosomal protein S18 acetylase RimI-like enzyme